MKRVQATDNEEPFHVNVGAVHFGLFCKVLGWAGGVLGAPSNGGASPLNYQPLRQQRGMEIPASITLACGPFPSPQWPPLTNFSPLIACLRVHALLIEGLHLLGTGRLRRPHLSRLSGTPRSSPALGSGSQRSALSFASLAFRALGVKSPCGMSLGRSKSSAGIGGWSWSLLC